MQYPTAVLPCAAYAAQCPPSRLTCLPVPTGAAHALYHTHGWSLMCSCLGMSVKVGVSDPADASRKVAFLHIKAANRMKSAAITSKKLVSNK